MPVLTTSEQESILTYIRQRINNQPITLYDVPLWLLDLERQRVHFQAIITIYQGLPYLAKLFIPSGIRDAIESWFAEKESKWTNLKWIK